MTSPFSGMAIGNYLARAKKEFNRNRKLKIGYRAIPSNEPIIALDRVM